MIPHEALDDHNDFDPAGAGSSARSSASQDYAGSGANYRFAGSRRRFRKYMKRPIPISPKYDGRLFEAVAFQVVLGLLSLLVLDGGRVAQVFGIALVAFWCGAAVLIWRHAKSPSRVDLQLIRYGYFAVLLISFLLVAAIWSWRGVV